MVLNAHEWCSAVSTVMVTHPCGERLIDFVPHEPAFFLISMHMLVMIEAWA